jgi:hypothetical protein
MLRQSNDKPPRELQHNNNKMIWKVKHNMSFVVVLVVTENSLSTECCYIDIASAQLERALLTECCSINVASAQL